MKAFRPQYVLVGRHTMAGTDWPIQNKIERDGHKWRVTFGLCNGSATGAKIFRTLKAAREAAGLE